VCITIPAPYWKTGVKALVWYLYLLQWHLVQITVKVIPYFLQCKSLQPWTGMLVCCSSSIGHCFPVHAPCGVGLVQAHIFCPNEIVDLVLLGSSSGTTALSLTHVQGKSHPSVESRWAQRRWSCLPSEKFRPSGCPGNGKLPTKPCDTTDPL